MTLKQAKYFVNNVYSKNINLQWFICKWNSGYIIHSSSYMRRFPDAKYMYSTGPLEKTWETSYSKEHERFIHKIKN